MYYKSEEKIINGSELEKRNQVYYKINETKPFTGKLANYYDNGQLRYEGYLKDGKQHGKFIWYDKDGKIETEVYYKDGKEIEENPISYKQESLVSEVNYKNIESKGYIYILINPSMEGLVKIGKTTRDPEERVKELSTTGVPTPFILIYKKLVSNCDKAENLIHLYLEERGKRLSSNREFFTLKPYEAIEMVTEILESQSFESENSNIYNEVETPKNNSEIGDDLFEQAETFYYGFDDEIPDYSKAIEFYEKAIKFGNIDSYLKLGIIYLAGEGMRANPKKAREYFQEGIRNNNIDCYFELGLMLLKENDLNHGIKAIEKYFSKINYSRYKHITFQIDKLIFQIKELIMSNKAIKSNFPETTNFIIKYASEILDEYDESIERYEITHPDLVKYIKDGKQDVINKFL